MGQSEKQNLQTVLTAMQVIFTEHHADQIDEFFTEDFIQRSPLVPPENVGREGLKQWLTGIVAAIPDLAYLPAPDQQMTDGDRVLVVAQVQGTIQGDLPLYGIKGSGQKLDVSTSHIFRLEHGKIASTGRSWTPARWSCSRPGRPDRPRACRTPKIAGRVGTSRPPP